MFLSLNYLRRWQSPFNRHRYQHQILFTCSYCVFLPWRVAHCKELKECKKKKEKTLEIIAQIKQQHLTDRQLGLLDLLQEAMKPKTCEGCKYKPNDGECYYELCGTCARFFYDHYEPKDDE